MTICTVLKILESVQNSYGLTRTLGEIDLYRDESGGIFYLVGGSVVIVKIWHNGELCAMRCYMRSARNLKEIYGEKYLPQELFVYRDYRNGGWIDVVILEWKEGQTLRSVVNKAVDDLDRATLKRLAERFDELARGIIAADWAHGDLTTENILVTGDGELELIDFDCQYLPQFQNQLSPELGTAAFQPPSRCVEDFDANIDNYSIALISTALWALSVEPSLQQKFLYEDGILYSPELISRGECKALEVTLELFLFHSMLVQYRVATLLKANMVRIPHLLHIFQRYEHNSQPLQLSMDYGYVGYSTLDDKVVLPHIYDEGSEFRNGVAIVRLAGGWCAIDLCGNVVVEWGKLAKIKSILGIVTICFSNIYFLYLS